MTKVGVLLSGCGVQDGSEIYETVLSLLALEKAGVEIVTVAPDIEQSQVVNHYTGHESRMDSKRHVLAESARIVRGKIRAINEVSAYDLDALIIPGGFGVVRNLCSFAVEGLNAIVDPSVTRLITELHGLGKPIGAICIAPVLVALALHKKNLTSPLVLTVGNDAGVSLQLTKMGVKPRETALSEICVDQTNKVVSTAAFMLAQGPAEAEPGITQLVNKVLELATANESL